jgi:N-hydroxyarylamine O-acetyltransferase
MNVNDYLARIDYSGAQVANADGLKALHRAHMLSVPFENLDIPLGTPIVLAQDSFYEKIVTKRRGGFCYELNGLFAWLLRQLGFSVSMLSARVIKEGKPGPEYDHLALMVELDEPRLVDVGFGDSFLEPLLLDSTDEQIQSGATYRLTGTRTEKRLEQRRDGAWEPQYEFSLQSRRLHDFSSACLAQQTSSQSPFTQKTVCSLATEEGRATLSSDRLILRSAAGRTEVELSSVQAYRSALHEYFGFDFSSDDAIERLMRRR